MKKFVKLCWRIVTVNNLTDYLVTYKNSEIHILKKEKVFISTKNDKTKTHEEQINDILKIVRKFPNKINDQEKKGKNLTVKLKEQSIILV